MNSIALSFAFIIYFTLLFGVAIISKARSKDSHDLILGNRSLNFWVTALSAHASDMSSWLFLAFPVSIYLGGIPQCWIAIALVTGMFLNWHCIAPRIRKTTEALEASTLSAFFAKRFPKRGTLIRITTTAACLLFLTYYLSAGMIGVGLVFESLFHIDYFFGLLFATGVVIGYTFIGGFVSVAWADLFQAIFLLIVIMAVPIFAIYDMGGVATFISKMGAFHIELNPFGSSITWKEIVMPFFAWGLGYFGMPHIITKFMAIDNPAELVKSKYVGLTWQILSLTASASCGLIAILFFDAPLANPESLFIEMSKQLFSPAVIGFAMCGIVAATVSTMDSQILVAASMVSEDLLEPIFSRPTESLKKCLFRIAVVAIASIALLIASSKNATIMETVYYAWAGLGSSFSPLMISALYSNRVTANGAIAGIVSGFLVSATWPSINILLTSANLLGEIPSMIPGFLISLISIWTFSLQENRKSELKKVNI